MMTVAMPHAAWSRTSLFDEKPFLFGESPRLVIAMVRAWRLGRLARKYRFRNDYFGFIAVTETGAVALQQASFSFSQAKISGISLRAVA